MPLSQTFVPTSFGVVRVLESDRERGPTIVYLHGWPQTADAFEGVMLAAGSDVHSVAMDLPGVGGSQAALPEGRKTTLAGVVREVIQEMNLGRVVLAGHDIGGQIVFAYLTRFAEELAAAIIMNVVIPGVPPWEEVTRNPSIWHFAFHNVPGLPELLVAGHERRYFDYFFDGLAHSAGAVSPASRQRYAAAYAKPDALKTGFGWYRAFEDDAEDNAEDNARRFSGPAIATPVLCVRGEAERGSIDDYVDGMRAAGLRDVRGTVIPQCGHFSADESPGALWERIRDFIADRRVL